jgi:hypothetical protein
MRISRLLIAAATSVALWSEPSEQPHHLEIALALALECDFSHMG